MKFQRKELLNIKQTRNELIFLKGFRRESLVNIIDYWAMMNNKDLDIISVSKDEEIMKRITEIMILLDGSPEERENLKNK